MALINLTPAITGVTTTTPSAGTAGSGQTVRINAALNEPITVAGGTPTLTLNNGGVAVFDPTASTGNNLVFNYAVQPGQNTNGLAVVGASANGANLLDSLLAPLNLSVLNGTPLGVVIDTIAPTLTGITADPANATLGVGRTVALTAATSEPVTVVGGTPTLTLSDGGTATFDAASSTPTSLVFRTTVQAGQNTSDLAILATSLNGATIADLAGNGFDPASLVINPAGTLVVDTTAPTVTAVATDPVSGTLGSGRVVHVNVSTSEPVTVTGATPTLSLSDGGTATFNAATSTPKLLVFDHTVQAGQSTPDLAITGANTTGTTIADSAANLLNLGAAVGNPAGTLTIDGSSTSGGGGTGGGTGGGGTGTTPTYGTIPIYRFFESTNGTHFYTPSAGERADILRTRPDLIPEGPGGVGLYAVDPASGDPNGAAVYRFFDTIHGTQFLTASAGERDTVIETRKDLTYEAGGTFYEHTQAQAGDTAVYRFFSKTDGTHFYTDNEGERATILQTRADLVSEGIGFYEPKHT